MADLAQREKWNTLTDAAAKEIERFDELRPMTLQPWLEDFENVIDMAQVQEDVSKIYLAMLKFSYDLKQQLQDRKEALGHS
uniref:Uncharacterized protein n=2 Tax=Moniliophthora roreri TaxID=221103 RepID=A0A0W0GFH3_MONRR